MNCTEVDNSNFEAVCDPWFISPWLAGAEFITWFKKTTSRTINQRVKEQSKTSSSFSIQNHSKSIELPSQHAIMTIEHIPYRLDNKVALVTGSGRGIGAAIATELGRLGAKVVVNYANSAESAEKVVAEIKSLGSDAIAFKADVRQVSQTAKLMTDAVAHFGGLDIVCSNSGVVSFGHLADVTEVSAFFLESLSFYSGHLS